MGLFRPSSTEDNYVDNKSDSTRVSQERAIVNKNTEVSKDLSSLLGKRDSEDNEKFISFQDESMLSDLNKVSKNRFSADTGKFIDSHDKELQKSFRELKDQGENPDMNLIKSIIAIETGFRPRKNALGYEGYPQTNGKNLNYINEKYGTKFTKDSLYDVKESAKFIHYFLKDIKKSKYVKDEKDMAAAYNWGTGNYGKYLNKSADLPEETRKYMDMVNTIKNYY